MPTTRQGYIVVTCTIGTGSRLSKRGDRPGSPLMASSVIESLTGRKTPTGVLQI
jgi:hypothetical protein